MMRCDRNGFAAPAGFREVQQGAAQLAQVVDRRRKAHQRFSSLAGGSVHPVFHTALVNCPIGRDFTERAMPDKRTCKLDCRTMLDFCSRKTEFDRSTAAVPKQY